MIVMENSALNFTLLNYKRKIFRLISKNKIKTVVYLILGFFIIFFIKDSLQLLNKDLLQFIPMIAFIYCIAKIMQNTPTINIRPELLELKVLNSNKLKSLILFKSTITSIIVLFLIIISKFELHDFITDIIMLLLINTISNLICFLIHQVKFSNFLRIGSIILLSVLYYYSLISITICCLIALIIYLFRLKYIKYDNILPYYKSISILSDSFLDGNINSINEERYVFDNKSHSYLELMTKGYDNIFIFHFYKEISRILYNKTALINSCIISFVISVLVNLYTEKLFIKLLAIYVIILLIDNLLTNLNKSENAIKQKGFYLSYKIKELLWLKITPQILVTLLVLVSGIFLTVNINIIILVILIVLIPLKNILYNFSNSKLVKLSTHLISILIYFLLLYNFVIYTK